MCTARAIPEPMMTLAGAARDAILSQLAVAPIRPTELLGTLGEQFADFELKETVLRLLHEGVVVMTSDRRLTLAEAE